MLKKIIDKLKKYKTMARIIYKKKTIKTKKIILLLMLITIILTIKQSSFYYDEFDIYYQKILEYRDKIPNDIIEVYEYIYKNKIFKTETIFYNFVIIKIESNFKRNAINKNNNGTRDYGYSQINNRTYENYKFDFINYILPKSTKDKSIHIIYNMDNLFDPYINILFSCYYLENVIYPKIKDESRSIKKILSLYNSNKLNPTNPITKRYIIKGITFLKEINFEKYIKID